MSEVISTQPLPSESVKNQAESAEAEEERKMQERLQQQQNREDDVYCCLMTYWLADCTESCCEMLAECVQCCNDSSGNVGDIDNNVDCGCCDCDLSD